MKYPSSFFIAALSLMTFISPANADAAGEAIKDTIAQAYAGIKTYSATVHFELRQTQGRWRTTQETEIKVAFDRKAGRLLIDKPDVIIAINHSKLFIKSSEEGFEGRHVETTLSTADANASVLLEYEALAKKMPFVAKPPLWDLLFLIGDKPLESINDGESPDIVVPPAKEDDADKRPTITFDSKVGRVRIVADSTTHLIAEVTIDLPADTADEQTKASLYYRFDHVVRDQPIEEKVFTIDTSGSVAVGSLAELMHEAADMGPSLEGQPAPPLDAVTLDGRPASLAEEKADVVVLEFWATWCRADSYLLPALQKVSAWAAQEKSSVAIYAINCEEEADVVKEFWEQKELKLPVLLDKSGKVARAFHIDGAPATVVIHKGTVVRVIPGLGRDAEERLKREITDLLAK
ncbi:MAG: TlpA family protein disulfide reductase [Phycisphaeraceae bacterium]|nr:TlpA family protein disulfide reductase [Phycisphaeraceae bacterium]